MFENVGVVAGVEGVTVIHGGSWKAAEFIKPSAVAQTAHALPLEGAQTTGKKIPG
jgi:hypothetical protein